MAKNIEEQDDRPRIVHVIGRYLPAPAIIVGFLLSAIIGYFVKDYLDSADIEVEVTSINFIDISDPDAEFTITNEIRRTYDVIPLALASYDDEMSAAEIEEAIFELSIFRDTISNAMTTISEMRSQLEEGGDASPEQTRKDLVSTAFSINGNAFNIGAHQALRKTGLMRQINQAQPGEQLHKYLSHPDEWRDPTNAFVPLGAQIYDLSEIETSPGDSPRQQYVAFTENVLRRMFIYMEPEVFGPILNATVDELTSTIEDIDSFGRALDSLRAGEISERIEARIYISNRGQRAASVDPVMLLHLDIGPNAITEKSRVVDAQRRFISNPIIVEPNSTSQYSVLVERSAETIPVAETTLSEFRRVSSAQVIEGRIGAYVRSALGAEVVISGTPLRMGVSAEEDQLTEISRAF